MSLGANFRLHDVDSGVIDVYQGEEKSKLIQEYATQNEVQGRINMSGIEIDLKMVLIGLKARC